MIRYVYEHLSTLVLLLNTICIHCTETNNQLQKSIIHVQQSETEKLVRNDQWDVCYIENVKSTFYQLLTMR